MKYTKKEKIYCLSEKDYLYQIVKGTQLYYDSDVDNYYYYIFSEKETKPDFFQIDKNTLTVINLLGYTGNNDIRNIIEWFEFKYRLFYSINVDRELLKSHIILDKSELNLLEISVEYIDERSKYILMKRIIGMMVLLFNVIDTEIIGPDTSIFIKNMEK